MWELRDSRCRACEGTEQAGDAGPPRGLPLGTVSVGCGPKGGLYAPHLDPQRGFGAPLGASSGIFVRMQTRGQSLTCKQALRGTCVSVSCPKRFPVKG